jgi:hypothetical protein
VETLANSDLPESEAMIYLIELRCDQGHTMMAAAYEDQFPPLPENATKATQALIKVFFELIDLRGPGATRCPTCGREQESEGKMLLEGEVHATHFTSVEEAHQALTGGLEVKLDLPLDERQQKALRARWN